MKRFLAIVLAFLLSVTMFVSCAEQGGKEKDSRKEENIAEQEKQKEQTPIGSEAGYGRKKFRVGDAEFSAGDTVGSLMEQGLAVELNEEELAPWDMTMGTVIFDHLEDGGMDIYIMNQSDVLRKIEDCRIYKIEMKTYTGIYFDEKELYHTNAKELWLEYQEDRFDFGEEDRYGEPLDYIQIETWPQRTVCGLTQVYLENVYGAPMAESYTQDARLQYSLEIAKNIIDIESYKNEQGIRSGYQPLRGKAQIEIEGVQIKLGAEGTTIGQLEEQKATFESEFETVAANGVNYYVLAPISIRGKLITVAAAQNFEQKTVEETDMRIVKIGCRDSQSPEYSNSDVAYAKFDVFGIRNGATLDELLKELGMPKQIEADEFNARLVYEWVDESGELYIVSYFFNPAGGALQAFDVSLQSQAHIYYP